MHWLQQPDCHLIAWHIRIIPKACGMCLAAGVPVVPGRKDLLWHRQIGIVGTRNQRQRQKNARTISHDHLAATALPLPAAGPGIDAAAHEAAWSGRTDHRRAGHRP